MTSPEELGETAQEAISNPKNDVFVSAVVGWEIAIKRSLGKLHAPADLITVIEQSGFQTLPIDLRHALFVEQLPWHHRDPFDRILIAQAAIEDRTLVSRDRVLFDYGVPVILA